MELFTAIRTAFHRRASERAASYQAAVSTLAGGGEIESEDLAELLVREGRSPAELESDVERVRQRQEDRELLDSERDTDQELAELSRQKSELKREFDERHQALQREWNQATAEIDQRCGELGAKQSEIRKGRQRLVETASPELKARESELLASWQAARAETQIAEGQERSDRLTLARLTAAGRQDRTAVGPDDLASAAAALRQSEARLAECRGVEGRLKSELESVRQSFLEG